VEISDIEDGFSLTSLATYIRWRYRLLWRQFQIPKGIKLNFYIYDIISLKYVILSSQLLHMLHLVRIYMFYYTLYKMYILYFIFKQESVRPRWPYDMRPSARAEKYMCVIVIR